MKGPRRFLECTVLNTLDRNTEFGSWEERAIPVADIKEIIPWNGAEQSERAPWKDTQSRVITKGKDGERYYVKEDVAELVRRIETPYV